MAKCVASRQTWEEQVPWRSSYTNVHTELYHLRGTMVHTDGQSELHVTLLLSLLINSIIILCTRRPSYNLLHGW